MTSPSPLSLGTPFSLGDPSVLHTARGDRLALGVNFLPAAAALGVASGIIHAPAGGVGELTLVSDAVLRVAPFVAVIQGTHNSRQGQYVVPNEQQRDLAVVGKDASLFRRSLIVVRVADSLEAGVAPSAATNGAWLERIDGDLAAANPALPPVPANSLPLGELSVPSAASGQPVQLTPYNPRTGARHGILPVFNDASAVPGHGSAPGTYVGQYRDHPVLGLQRWTGAEWSSVIAPSTYTACTIGGGWNAVAGHIPRWKRTPHNTVRLSGWFSNGGAYTANATQFPITGLPAPAATQVVEVPIGGGNVRGLCTLLVDGRLRIDTTQGVAIAAGSSHYLDCVEYDPIYPG